MSNWWMDVGEFTVFFLVVYRRWISPRWYFSSSSLALSRPSLSVMFLTTGNARLRVKIFCWVSQGNVGTTTRDEGCNQTLFVCTGKQVQSPYTESSFSLHTRFKLNIRCWTMPPTQLSQFVHGSHLRYFFTDHRKDWFVYRSSSTDFGSIAWLNAM